MGAVADRRGSCEPRLPPPYGVTIPTVLPERQPVLDLLLVQLGLLAPDAPVAVSRHIEGEPARDDCLRALRLGATLGRRWVVYLEDDAYLAPVFDQVARRTLAEADAGSHRLVSFYSDNRRVLRAADEGRTTCTLEARYLWSTVCVAVRAADVAAVAAFAPRWYDDHPEHWHASDLLLGSWCRTAGSDVVVAVPSPVQHRDLPSTLGHDVVRRRYSRTFRRAYGPVR
jgi:hypothetical protein